MASDLTFPVRYQRFPSASKGHSRGSSRISIMGVGPGLLQHPLRDLDLLQAHGIPDMDDPGLHPVDVVTGLQRDLDARPVRVGEQGDLGVHSTVEVTTLG